MSPVGRDRSLIIPWLLALGVCGLAATLTLAIDRVGKPTTEIRVGDQGDSVRAPGATTTVASATALGDSTPRAAAALPNESATTAIAGASVDTTVPTSATRAAAAATSGRPAGATVASTSGSSRPTSSGTSSTATLSNGTSTSASTASSAPVSAEAAERASTSRGAPPRAHYAGVPATPRQPSAAERTADARAVSAARERAARYRRAERERAAAVVASSGAKNGAADRPTVEGDHLSAATVAAVADSVRVVLDRAIADSAFPGAYAVIGTRQRVIAARGVGHLDARIPDVPNGRTIYDLASLTKVIGTTTAMMQLVERGSVSLDAPVQRYLPEWTGANKDRVTVRHLLTHSAGLPATRPFFRRGLAPAATLALVYAEPLDTTPGARFVYSDLGAILLGEIVGRVSHTTLDAYLASHVFTPLGMTSTRFRPDSSLLPRIAPTEQDPWRGRLVRGEVHDENAAALGGVAGHAGLFSTGDDLARFARMLLDGGALDGTRVVGAETVRAFTTLQDSALSNRALGWEKPTGGNSAGHRLSREAFGHTGFTGTSIWIDPTNDVFVILLSNRVDPSRANNRIRTVRTALADAVLGALGVPAPAAAARTTP